MSQPTHAGRLPHPFRRLILSAPRGAGVSSAQTDGGTRVALIWAVGVAVLQGLIAWAMTTQRVFYGTVSASDMFNDDRLYFNYASKMLGGAIPYRDYLVEYPPFALPLFVIPRFFAATLDSYKVAFAVEMLVLNAVALFLLARLIVRDQGAAQVPGRLAWYTVALSAFCPLAICRFDLAAMALAFAAAWAWVSGRPRLAGTLAGIGTLMKIVPGVVAGPAAVKELTRGRAGRWGGVVWFVGVTALGVAAWFGVGGGHVRDSLGYHIERGIEIGSLYSGAMLLAAKVVGLAPKIIYSHISLEVSTPWSAAAMRLAFPVQVTALALVLWRSRRWRAIDPMRLAAAAVLTFLLFGKVLSPQYLIWLLPFVAVLRGRVGFWARGIFVVACVVTTMLYPLGFRWLLDCQGWAVGLLNYRNVLLLGLWGLLLYGPDDAPVPAEV